MHGQGHLFEIESSAQWSTRAGAATLVLVHDGSGTTFSYHCLGALRRPFYAIANPLYESGESWEGGIPEMARHYVRLAKTVVAPGGDLIVGGWSLGGLVALEMASILAGERERERERERQGRPRSELGPATFDSLNLLGIVMIDSVCPLPPRNWDDLSAGTQDRTGKGPASDREYGKATAAPFNGVSLRKPIVQHTHEWGPHTRPETKERVLHCFAESWEMVQRWEMPRWRRDTGDDSAVGSTSTVTADNGTSPQPVPPSPPPPPPPRIVLLRAQEAVPVPSGTDGVVRVDVHRGDRLLGWGEYCGGDLVVKVVDVPGNHYDIFRMDSMDERLNVVTQRITEACELLEGTGAATAPSGLSSPTTWINSAAAAASGAASGDAINPEIAAVRPMWT